jgi:hypothetical protein
MREILNKWLYGRFNFTVNLNRSFGHESSTGGWSSYEGIFPTVGLGFDFYTSKNNSFNISFFKLLKEKIKYDYGYQWNNKLGEIEKVVTDECKVPFFIKLGFSFYWDIL